MHETTMSQLGSESEARSSRSLSLSLAPSSSTCLLSKSLSNSKYGFIAIDGRTHVELLLARPMTVCFFQ